MIKAIFFLMIVNITVYCFRTFPHCSFKNHFVYKLKSSPNLYILRSLLLSSSSLSSSSSSSSSPSSPSSSSSKDEGDVEADLKKEAMDILECLTSPRDENHPEYNIEKDMRRDQLLADTDYSELKLELRQRGLRTKGDKVEMMIRILLNVIDPTINFDELSGREATLKFVDNDDILTNKIKVVPAEQRVGYSGVLDEMGPDAEDLKVLRRRVRSSINNKVGGGLGYDHKDNSELPSITEKPLIIMDGLTRREIEIPCISAQRLMNVSKIEDKDINIRAYIVGGRDVLKTWEKNSAATVVLSDELGWRSKSVRIFADELAFSNQAIVIVPDIFRGESFKVPHRNNTNSTHLTRKQFRDLSYLKSVEFNNWLDGMSYQRIFDDVAATLYFALTEYKCQSISVAGLGIGGGWALQISNDLSDISALAVFNKVLNDTNTKFPPETFLDLTADLGSSLMPDASQAILKSMGNETVDELLSTFQNEIENELKKSKYNFIEDHDRLDDIFFDSANSNFYESKEEWQSRYEKIEEERSNVERRRTAIASKRGMKLLSEQASLTLQQLASLEPKAVLAICPSSNNIKKLSEGTRAATMLVYGSSDSSIGSGKDDGVKFHSLLASRSNEIIDYSVRIYDDRDCKFVHDPLSDDDKKCSEDVISIGSIWLDAYSRNFNIDATDESGKTKSSSSSLKILKKEDMLIPIRGTTVATYLHDDPTTFSNLDTDSIIKNRTHKNKQEKQ